jgi:NADH:quinone reductase (non-electrogenic)
MDKTKTMDACMLGEEICLPDTTLPRIVVIGGGFAGISLIKKLRNKKFQIVLLDRNNFHQFQPLLYQVATSGIEPDSIVFPLRKIFKGYRNVFFRMAEVKEIRPEDNIVSTKIGTVKYDYLVIATGSDTNFFGLKDVQQNSVGMKTIQEALDIRSLILQHLEKAVVTCDLVERDALTNFAIIGGGPAGVETAGAIAEFKKYILPKDYTELDASMMSIFLIEAGDELLKSMSAKSTKNAKKYLLDMGVEVKLNTLVQSYDGLTIKTKQGEELKARTVIWAAGVKGNVPGGIGKEQIIGNNRIQVDQYSRVKGYKNIFALGDIAAMVSENNVAGHPMVAQVAIQQGHLLANNLIAMGQNKKPVPFSYNDKGSLATVGKRKAVADLGKLNLGGIVAWWLWSGVHLLSISGFRNKLLVGLNWAWSYFTYDKGNRLIIRKFDKNDEN